MKSKRILVSILMVAGLFVGSVAISQNIKLNPIKPGAKSSAQISDEQQAILAVRSAKASVVSIVGSSSDSKSGEIVNAVSGTGFVIDASGLVVSNNHVVQDTKLKYYVVLPDGSQYDAKILGQDKFNDVALLKIEASGLTPAKLGNSDDLETGQTVFAIGNSLGIYQNSVTRGVVSGLGRAIDLSASQLDPQPRLQNLIQTDASINLGNSGGPLVNLAGEVVGMNTLVDRLGEGLGFAVPINAVKDSISELKSFGKVSKPYAGISFITLNKALAEAKQLSTDQGALIEAVATSSPAERAGLKAGDIITEVNHGKLTQANEIDSVISRYHAGDQVLIKYVRDKQEIEAPLILVEYK